jgi:hypothetical protein
MPFEAPAQSGDILKPADIQNHILAVAPVEYIPHLPNVNTKPGEMSPAIRCNVADFSALDESGQPAVYQGVLWFNQMLHSNLKRQVGQYVLGQMVTGQATPGRNAPFQLMPVTDAAWISHCGNWLDHTPQGEQFQMDAATAIAQAQNAAAVAQVGQSAPASAPPAPPAPPAAPSGGFASPPAPAATPAAPPAPAAPAAVGGPDLSGVPDALKALISQLPPDQQAAAIAVASQQGQASS